MALPKGLITRELVAIPTDIFTKEELEKIDNKKLHKAMVKAFELGERVGTEDTVAYALS